MKNNQKYWNQDINNFCGRIKLPAHFGPNEANKKQAEEDIFKPSNKNWLKTHRNPCWKSKM